MCTIFIAIQESEELPFVLCANRDEFFERETEPMHWWEGEEMLAGRDIKAGGTWLALDQALNFALVTNYREPGFHEAKRRSRGELPLRALKMKAKIPVDVIGEAEEWNGFNLISGNALGFQYFCNRPAFSFLEKRNGLYGLSNANLDDPWPKVTRGKAELSKMLKQGKVGMSDFLDLMGDKELAPDSELPQTGIPMEWERQLSSICIQHGNYGTRVSTVVLLHKNGRVEVTELNRLNGERRDFEFQKV